MNYSAVITAGGRVDQRFAAAIGTSVKALAPLRDGTMLSRTIAALLEADFSRIAVVGGDEVARACKRFAVKLIPESDDGAVNLTRALNAWDRGSSLLYLTSDMPFITSRALRAFVAAVPPGTLAMPLTKAPVFDARFPGAPPFGVVLGGERWINGGVFVIPAGAAAALGATATKFFRARKSVWKMAQLAGPTLLLRFALRTLRVQDLERRARCVLAIPAIAVRQGPPELAYDVDTLEEYRYASAHGA